MEDNIIMKREGLNCFGRFVAGEIVDRAYKLNISEESKQNLNEVGILLKDDKNLSVIFYGNHTTNGDSGILGFALNIADPEGTRKIFAPMSYSHTKFDLKNSSSLALAGLVELSGVETKRVIQTYQITDENRDKAKEYSASYFRTLREYKRKGVSVALIIFPEGHRPEDGKMIKFEDGLVASGFALNPVLYVPVGINFQRPFDRSGLNFGNNVTVGIGDYYLQTHRENMEETNKILTTNLARVVFEERRGFYADLPEIRK